MDQELVDAAAYAPGRHCVGIHQMAALFYMKWRHGRRVEKVCLISKIRLQRTIYVFAWRTILPNFIPIRFKTRALGFFKEVAPKENKNNKMSSDMGSVPDPKKIQC